MTLVKARAEILIQLELYMRPFEKLIRVSVQDGAERVVRSIKGLVERESAPPGSAAEVA